MMNRCVLCVVVLTLGVRGVAAAERDFSNVQIKTTHVAGPIYMLEGQGGNFGVGNIGVSVGADGILMVDDQFAPLAEKIKAALKELRKGNPAFVLNTHFHHDHTGGNPTFGREATIIAHTNVRKRLANPPSSKRRPRDPMPKVGLPVITFDESLSLHFNGEEIRAIHFPHGHTDSDSVIFFTGSNVVHMGDQFFQGKFPYVDFSSGGDVLGYTKNVKAVMGQLNADVKIIPGHGALSNLSDLKEFHRMLVETTDIVRSRMTAGQTLDQIRKEGLPDKWQGWASGLVSTERWLIALHNSLARNASK